MYSFLISQSTVRVPSVHRQASQDSDDESLAKERGLDGQEIGGSADRKVCHNDSILCNFCKKTVCTGILISKG